MKFVDAGQKGISVKLSDPCQKRIFTDTTDDGQDLVIVKGRVVRVDAPSARMGIALNQPVPDPENKGKSVTLLVETDEDPTPVAQPLNIQLQTADKEQQKAILEAEAARLGFTLQEAPVTEGDATSLVNGKTVSAVVDAPDTGSNSSNKKGS